MGAKGATAAAASTAAPNTAAPQRNSISAPAPISPPRSRPSRVSPESDRREHLLAAAVDVLVRDGIAGLRIRDVAVAAGVSTGVVHYYFGTKDEILVEALRWAARVPVQRLGNLRQGPDYAQSVASFLEMSLPHPGVLRDEYVLWLELWSAVCHDATLLPVCEELTALFRSEVMALVSEGTQAGTFHPVTSPTEVSERIIALVESMCLSSAIGYSWLPLDRVRELLRSFVCEQLGLAPNELPYVHLNHAEQPPAG